MGLGLRLGTLLRLWALLELTRADFTLFFRRLTQVAAGEIEEEDFRALFANAPAEAQKAAEAPAPAAGSLKNERA